MFTHQSLIHKKRSKMPSLQTSNGRLQSLGQWPTTHAHTEKTTLPPKRSSLNTGVCREVRRHQQNRCERESSRYAAGEDLSSASLIELMLLMLTYRKLGVAWFQPKIVRTIVFIGQMNVSLFVYWFGHTAAMKNNDWTRSVQMQDRLKFLKLVARTYIPTLFSKQEKAGILQAKHGSFGD